MMELTERPSRHLSDGDLVRYIDGEGEPTARQDWSGHVDACETCAESVATLRAESAIVTGWLERAAFEEAEPRSARPARPAPASAPAPAPRRAAASPWLRAAAILLLVAAPVAAVPAAREWVADRLGAIRSAVAPADDVPLRAAAPAPVLRFVPGPGTFTVVLESMVTDGAITVGRSGSDEAVFRVDGPERVDALLSERALRLGNAAAPSARYSLLLPASVPELVVVTPRGRTAIGAGEIDTGAVVPLVP